VVQSIELLVVVVVGGLATLSGSIVGAAIVVAIPPVLSVLRESLPAGVSQRGGLEIGVYGLLLLVFVRWEPDGLVGRWRILRRWLEEFPLARRHAHRRQRRTLRTERWR
jgi:branched-chain amino acid transport system permease protein